MRLQHSGGGIAVIEGDALQVLGGFPEHKFDAVITDPPYGLAELKASTISAALSAWLSGDREFVPSGKGFMGHDWDAFVPPPAVWDEAKRVMKPGAYLICFAGSRTHDLMTLSIRLAGFEIRDSIAWLYGQGMPKSKDSLKGSFEPIIVARKPFKGSLKANIAEHGTGGLNADAGRLPFGDEIVDLERRQVNFDNMGYMGAKETEGVALYKPGGRWPPNVAMDEESAAALDAQTGVLTSGKAPEGLKRHQAPRESGVYGGGQGLFNGEGPDGEVYGDSGGASRFYYVAKAVKKERVTVDGVSHPTVKPLSLMEWLVALFVPAGGRLIDPFAGSGTTGVAAVRAGRSAVLVENEEKYVPLIIQRVQESLRVRDSQD